MKILGVDFTSAPKRSKPLTAAVGRFSGHTLTIHKIERLATYEAFEELLRIPGPWIGAFDFPFGLPREAVEDLGWPTTWRELTRRCVELGKLEFKRQLDEYRESREQGDRYATRKGDKASGAHPAVKLVNPPVGLMFFEGAPRLAAANVTVPFLSRGDPSRVALEAYPGMFIRKHLAIRDSYKNDRRSKQTKEHAAIRRKVLGAMKAGKPHGIYVQHAGGTEEQIIADGTGDNLDAVVCAAQASWGHRQGAPDFGLPPNVDPIEGWIISA